MINVFELNILKARHYECQKSMAPKFDDINFVFSSYFLNMVQKKIVAKEKIRLLNNCLAKGLERMLVEKRLW